MLIPKARMIATLCFLASPMAHAEEDPSAVGTVVLSTVKLGSPTNTLKTTVVTKVVRVPQNHWKTTGKPTVYVVEQSTGYTTILSECKVAADDNGTWSFISNSLPNATYTIWAEQKFIQTTSSDWERIGSAFSKLEIKLKDNPDKKACGGTLAFDETSPSRNGNQSCLDASGTWDIHRGWKLKKSHKQDIFYIPVDGGLIRYSGLLKNDKVEPKWGPTKVYMETGLKYNAYTSLAFEMDLEKPPEAGFPPGSVPHTVTRIAVDR